MGVREEAQPLEVAGGTLTLADGRQIALGAGVMTHNPGAQARLRSWEMEYSTESPLLHQIAELAHIPQRIELYGFAGERWCGRALIAAVVPDRLVRLVGYGPLERMP